MSEIKHYGTPRHSGRYPWGSGQDPEQRTKSFLGQYEELKKQGLSEVDIARGLGMSTSQLRNRKTIEKANARKTTVAEIIRLKEKGVSQSEIARRLNMPESSVRSYLKPVLQQRSEITEVVANMLKDTVEKKKYVDVGLGTENHIGVRRTKLKASLSMLEEEGYRVHKFDIEQVGTGKKTNMMVLTKDNVTYGELLKNKDKIRLVTDYSEDGGRTFTPIEPVRSIDSKRIQIRYNEEGGSDKDGVIELRRGVDEISLGNSHYAQVRIGVDNNHYLKGMAMYCDDMPKGIDIIYNTNKKKGTPKESVFKTMNKDAEGNIDVANPFGAIVRQKHYIDSKGNKQLSALNIVGMKEGAGEEGSWGEWSKTLSSQMLSKQTPSLAKRQLGLAHDAKKEEFDEIMSITNPAVRRILLTKFADGCDSSAVHLKAAGFPRQQTHVILPLPDIKETEIYAPNYRDGERVVLIRHPHGGTFEIPELIVNNKQKSGRALLGGVKDAVGIHPKVANKLSGADFDGDNVLVIPNSRGLIDVSPSLKGLSDFDPKESYPPYHGMRTIDGGIWNKETNKVEFKEGTHASGKLKQTEMGKVSNLITDMTIKGADSNEIARAVRHSMVVIDSEKHHLDYKQSYIDNGVASLKKKYQGGENKGASTLISKASSEYRVGTRKERPANPITGEKQYEYTNETITRAKYRDPNTGRLKETTLGNAKKRGYEIVSTRLTDRQIVSTRMAETKDAYSLSSGTPIESIYAEHANKMKALGNTARKEALITPRSTFSASAKETYAPEISSLKAQLNIALKNKPLERQAQLLANSQIALKRQDNPDMDAEDLKKEKTRALIEARARTGARRKTIEISGREWEAIQAGALSNNLVVQILENTDPKRVTQLALPRTSATITDSKLAIAKSRLASGYTQAEVADSLGVSVTTLLRSLE